MSKPSISDIIGHKFEMGDALNQAKEIFDRNPGVKYEDFPLDQKSIVDDASARIGQSQIAIGKKLLEFKQTLSPRDFLALLVRAGDSPEQAKKYIDLAQGNTSTADSSPKMEIVNDGIVSCDFCKGKKYTYRWSFESMGGIVCEECILNGNADLPGIDFFPLPPIPD